jgi:hypothetical protein
MLARNIATKFSNLRCLGLQGTLSLGLYGKNLQSFCDSKSAPTNEDSNIKKPWIDT